MYGEAGLMGNFPQKIVKSTGSEMVFSSFSMTYFLKHKMSLSSKVKGRGGGRGGARGAAPPSLTLRSVKILKHCSSVLQMITS